jgi:conjugal transfer pilus assembly protein TraK
MKLYAKTSLALAAMWIGAPVMALQTIDARDGVTAEAAISLKEATRIRIDGARIANVVGNLHYGSSCDGQSVATPGQPQQPPQPINPAAEVVLECDKDRGEVYVRPLGKGTKPVNLFISSAQATYTLVLKRQDIPADTIVITDKTLRQTKPPAAGSSPGLAAAAPPPPDLAPLARSPAHIRALKSMLVVMATGRVPADMHVEELGQPVQLWQEAQFSLMRTYHGRGLVGEVYFLTNISGKPMVLAEQEFDRPEGDVTGVSIDNHNLRPGESTNVYVIRLGS